MTALLFYRLSFYWLANCRIDTLYPNQLIFRALCIFSSYVPSMLYSRWIFHYLFHWNHSIVDRFSTFHLKFVKDILWKTFYCQEEPKLNIATSCLCMCTAGKSTPFPQGLLDPASPPHLPWHKPQHWNTVAEHGVPGTEAFIPQQNTHLC